MTIRILAIPGSLRRASYNKALLDAAVELAPNGVSVTVYEGLAQVPPFNEDLVEGPLLPRGVARLRRAVSASDALLFATPEYNQAVPGVLKNAIDWLSMGEAHEGLENRPVGITGVTSGPWGTRLAQTMLRQMLLSTQALVLPQPTLYLRNGESLFDASGRLSDPKTRRRLADLIAALAVWSSRFVDAGRCLQPVGRATPGSNGAGAA